jgi:protein-tyrosine phosphatase
MKTEIYWVPETLGGRLGIAARPRGGDWLADEVATWRAAGVDVLVSLLTSDEIAALDLDQEAAVAKRSGMDFLSFPIADRNTPASRNATLRLVHGLEKRLNEGKNVLIHCRQGIGRAGLMAAAILVVSGAAPKEAFRSIGSARGCPVPETAEQQRWIVQLAEGLDAVGKQE